MDDQEKKKRKERNEIMRSVTFMSQIGVTMVSCVVIGVFLGKFLDSFFGTSPWLIIIFSLLGAVAAVKAVFDLTMRK